MLTWDVELRFVKCLTLSIGSTPLVLGKHVQCILYKNADDVDEADSFTLELGQTMQWCDPTPSLAAGIDKRGHVQWIHCVNHCNDQQRQTEEMMLTALKHPLGFSGRAELLNVWAQNPYADMLHFNFKLALRSQQ